MSHQFFQDQKQMVNNNNIPMQSGNQTAPAAPIIHIRDDSSSQMDALFSVLDKPPPSNSLKHRNLPETFFIQPKIGRHSRDNSLDCTLNAFPIGDGTPQPGGQVGGLKVMHVKSASLPAQFPQTMSLAPQPGDLGKTDHGGQIDAMIGGNTADLWQQQQKLQQQSAKLKQPGVSRSGQGHMRTNHVSVHQGQDLGRLPEGWDQGMTPEGEVYFINHIDKTTTWFDPRLPESAQRALQSQKQKLLQDQLIKQQQQTAAVNQGVANQDFIQSELRRLRQEGEKLRQQMEQVTQQEQMWAQLLSSKAAGPQAKPATVAAGLSGVDAFLGQMPIKQEYHARQSSNDSGLGINIGTQGYSLPRTPDDCLSNVDDMDVAIESGRSMKKLTLNSGGMVTTPAQHSMVGGNMFMHAGGGAMIQGAGPVLPVNQMSLDVIGGGLDVYSDELLPSLQEPGVYADVLNDLVDQKMENMQWL